MKNNRSITPNEPADFTPAMGNYRPLQPFRYWCQKVLPLVYDDSLSYYELLCKVIDYLNKTMEDVETLHEDVTNLHTAYEELQGYVNNYFSTLDVQEEINNKLDSLVLDGTLPSLINNLFSNTINPVFVGNVSEMTDHNKQYVLTTDASGHIWYWNGSQFTESSTLFGNTNILFKFNDFVMSNDGNVSILNNPSDGWYWLYNNRNTPFDDAPYSTVDWVGSLDVKRYVATDNSVNITETLVIMESVSNMTHTMTRIYRKRWSKWTETVKFNDFVMSNNGDVSILNNPSDGWYWLYNNRNTHFDDAPYSTVDWVGSLDVKRYVATDNSVNITETLVIMESVSNMTHTMTRIYRKGWSKWTETVTNDKIKNNVDFNLSSFDSIVSIGDSLSCGYQRINGNIISNNYELSPFQYFVKKYGTKVFWGGASGATSVALINNETSKYNSNPYTPKGMNYVESLGAKALYVISLGTNDSGSGEKHVPIGSTKTVNDRTTFYGALNYIVSEINRIAPSAYVLLVSGFNVNVNVDYRINAPKYVASLYNNAIFIDITDELKQLTKYTRDGHYVTFGYYSIGSFIDSIGGKAIAEASNAWLDVGNANVNSTVTDINPYEKA